VKVPTSTWPWYLDGLRRWAHGFANGSTGGALVGAACVFLICLWLGLLVNIVVAVASW